MVLLDVAGGVLPEGLEFLKLGWWVLHVLAVALVFAYGYRRGRLAERREPRDGRPPSATTSPPSGPASPASGSTSAASPTKPAP